MQELRLGLQLEALLHGQMALREPRNGMVPQVAVVHAPGELHLLELRQLQVRFLEPQEVEGRLESLIDRLDKSRRDSTIHT